MLEALDTLLDAVTMETGDESADGTQARSYRSAIPSRLIIEQHQAASGGRRIRQERRAE